MFQYNCSEWNTSIRALRVMNIIYEMEQLPASRTPKLMNERINRPAHVAEIVKTYLELQSILFICIIDT